MSCERRRILRYATGLPGWRSFAIFLLLAVSQLPLFGAAKPKPTDDVLILYDSSGQYGWVGEMNARFLVNLLGHFPQT